MDTHNVDPPRSFTAGLTDRSDASCAFEAAVAAHYAELCDFVLRFVGSVEVAEDVVHDLFLHLWESRGRRDLTRLTRPYLYVAARNRALKYLRHRRVAKAWCEHVAREALPTSDTPEAEYLQTELEATVERAIAELPARCREVFVLRRRYHLSYDDIAVRVGSSLGTVKSHMWRATALLRRKLAPYLTSLTLIAGAF
ncbi:MAG TPA: RNA polymerase sigma-70 factor [Gemmatimonadaceae bacterium]|nr:RNA polymerase sigma-70 factor [Gemmatimonadaceae bacterium]